MKLGKYFYIRSQLPHQLVLEVSEQLDRPGTAVVTAEARGEEEANDSQLWWYDAPTRTVRCKLNSYCLTDNNGAVVISPFVRGKTSQQWVLADDKVQTQDDFDTVLGILDPDDNTGPDAAIGTVTYEGHEGQHFTFEHRPAHFFIIRSQENENKIMDVYKADKKAGTHVICWPDKGNLADNQLWYEDEDGLIRSKLNDFAIDTSGKNVVLNPLDKNNSNQAWTINGCNIQNRDNPQQVLEYSHKTLGFLSGDAVLKATSCGTQNQMWLFQPIHGSSASMNHTGNGKVFYIRSGLSGLVLGIESDSLEENTPVVTCYRKGAGEDDSDQLFFLDEATGTIRSYRNEAYCLDISKEDDILVLSTYDAFNKMQQWQPMGNKIHNRHDPEVVLRGDEGEPLDDDGFETGKNVTMAKQDGGLEEQWEVRHLPARCFYLRSLDTKNVLDVNKDEQSVGAKVIIWNQKPTISENQLWYEDEKCIIRSKLSGYVLQATGSGCCTMPYDPHNKDQAWMLVGDRIQNKFKSSLVLDVAGKLKGAKVIAYKFNGGNNQKWKVEYV